MVLVQHAQGPVEHPLGQRREVARHVVQRGVPGEVARRDVRGRPPADRRDRRGPVGRRPVRCGQRVGDPGGDVGRVHRSEGADALDGLDVAREQVTQRPRRPAHQSDPAQPRRVVAHLGEHRRLVARQPGQRQQRVVGRRGLAAHGEQVLDRVEVRVVGVHQPGPSELGQREVGVQARPDQRPAGAPGTATDLAHNVGR